MEDLVRKQFSNPWAMVDHGRTIRELVRGSGLPEVDVQAAFARVFGSIEEVRQAELLERARQRTAMLMERLQTWPISRWSEIFSEQPNLQSEMSPGQRRDWDAYRASQGHVTPSPAPQLSIVKRVPRGGQGRKPSWKPEI